MFNRRKIRYIDQEEMNERLEFCKKYRGIFYSQPDNNPIRLRAFIEDKVVEFKLTYKSEDEGNCTFIVRKDGAGQSQKISGMDAFIILSQYYKVPRRRAPFSASPLLWKNDKYDGTRHFAIGYDVNSSYSFAMLKDMPDTSVEPRMGDVKEGEIGFSLDGTPKFKGYSNWIFPLMESPFKRFVEKYYEMKKNAQTPEEKNKAKGVLNYSVGYLQRVNPFLRSTIIYYANEMIKNLINEDTLYCNTDSLVSLSPRTDIQIGTNIGDFKVEHTGMFAFKGFNHQWDNEVSYRGIPKSWFKEDFDILKDEPPSLGNIMEFDRENIELRKVNR